ncbi:unnamed protein product [Closterium sp. NIES-54]
MAEEVVATVEVQYVPTEELQPVEDLESVLSGLGAKLDSKDWFVVCEGLIELRRVAKFNSERLNERLGSYYDSMLKSLKNPRSVLRKTLWMTFEDLFRFNTTCMEGSLESLMQPLLIQASQDNKFMVEAVDRALSTMTSTLNPEVTFKAVQPCIAHKSPRVRSKAMIYAYQAAVRLNMDQVKVIGLDVLLKIAATQMKDQAPEGREAARKLAVYLHSLYVAMEDAAAESQETSEPWEGYCSKRLSSTDAAAVLKVSESQELLKLHRPTNGITIDRLPSRVPRDSEEQAQLPVCDPNPCPATIKEQELGDEDIEAWEEQYEGVDDEDSPFSSTCSFLEPGQAFVGTQNVSSSSSPGDSSPPLSGMERDEAWRVTVRIQQCDMRRGYLCGSMEALNVPSTDTSVVTFWDGEIVDGKNYSFFTGQWDAT